VKRRSWTILVVPHDTESPREFVVGERTLRWATTLGVLAGVLVVGAVGVLFSPLATPGARMLARQNAELEAEVRRLDGALASVGDSLATLAEREAQFRAIAGLSSGDSILLAQRAPVADGAEAGSPAPRPAMARASLQDRPRPFAAFFGERAARPDVDALLAKAAELSTAFEAVNDTMATRMDKLRATPSILPAKGLLTGEFSHARMHPILRELRPHVGIDLSAPTGTPIVAPAAGVVRKATRDGAYGNVVEIDHGNGIMTRYAHAQRLLVRAGQRVERGTQIATVGSTGLSVGPHLHYEIHVNGTPVDPLTYVLPD
jgi:murein DD-endopeptidase MepM/ murein hydrolase activator NlpD